jgi:hypothetical protein
LQPPLSDLRRIVLGVVAAAVLSAVSAGCGSSSKPESAADWTDGLCSAVVTWTDSIKSAGSKFSSGNVSKASLQDAKSEVSAADSKLRDDLKALGKPPTTGADQARSTMSDLWESLKTDAGKIDDAVKGVSSVSDVSSAVSTITGTVTSMGAEISSASQQLKALAADDPWKKAFSESKSCQSLTR